MGFLVVGAAVVLAVGLEVGRTVLDSSGRGPLSRRPHRVVRAVPGAARARALGLAGPVIVAASLALWVIGLWVGFAIVYVAFAHDLAYAPSVPFGDRGRLDALYLSAVALTTVGFGDVVAESPALRFVTILGSGSGLVVVTALLSYTVSSSPATSLLRAAAARATDLGAGGLEGVVSRSYVEGRECSASCKRDVLDTEQNLTRFPVLFPPVRGATVPAEPAAGRRELTREPPAALCPSRSGELGGISSLVSASTMPATNAANSPLPSSVSASPNAASVMPSA
jgi:hypothetical protein